MIAFTAAEIADITKGRLDADPGITPLSVVTDSREATPGSLYVAKPGEYADGHDFVEAAFTAGAALALVERAVAAPDGFRGQRAHREHGVGNHHGRVRRTVRCCHWALH